MQESLLHYIWQFQYFDKFDLRTTAGEEITIFNPGIRNTHAGPDFSNARIKIGDLEWIGTVEIHIYASGWNAHRHHRDAAYGNVVLHVVWKEDDIVSREDNTSLPTLELQTRVSPDLILRYNELFLNPGSIPCATSIANVGTLTKYSMLDKTVMSRLESKSSIITSMLMNNQNDWEETCYQLLCKNFGFKINSDPFLMLAKSLPYKVIMKHADKIIQIESLLFGQAGFLDEEIDDEYFNLLKREYRLLSKKFNLEQTKLNKAQWRLLRLRPANFPSIRLAQLAGLLYSVKSLFSKFMEANSYRDLKELLCADQSDYWKRHYLFGKDIQEEIPSMGRSSVDNIVVNTVVPLMVAYGKSKDDDKLVDRAIAILQEVIPEENIIIKEWKSLGIHAENAFDTQGLIELYNNYCMRRRCLDCTIGSSLVRPPAV